jgi:glycosidase
MQNQQFINVYTQLVYCDYEDLALQDAKLFAYTRTLGSEKYLVVLNFSRDNISYTLPAQNRKVANFESRK